jgi:hypothetical protein
MSHRPGTRQILIIGSQCASLGPLSFVEETARSLHEVMIDPAIGGCISAFENGPLIDPTVGEALDAITAAYRRAVRDEATLFLAYIGHGTHVDDDYYLGVE